MSSHSPQRFFRLYWILTNVVTLSWPQRLRFWTLVIMSWPISGPEFCVVWLRKMPASGWGSLRESSSFVSWFSTFVFRNVLGTVPECVRIRGFKRISSNLDRAPKMRDSVLLNSWDSFFSDSAFNLLRNFCDIFRVNSKNGRVSWLADPRMFLLCFSCNGCQPSFVSQCCHLFEGKMLGTYEDWMSFYLLIKLRF